MFKKKFKKIKLDLKGGKQWRYSISHTIYACFQTVLSFEYDTKKNSFKMWSHICGKIAMLVHEVTLKKKGKKVKTVKT